MESTTGKIVATRKDKVGTTLSQDHATGATTLVVTDPFEFNEDGGTLDIDGTTYTYTGWDDDASTITLTTGLAADAEAGADVLLLPLEKNMVAIVVEDDSGEQIDADVRHGDALNLPEGQLVPPVTATLLFDGERWLVDDIVGRTPTPDAGLLVGTPPPGFLDDTEFAADLAAALADIGDITEFGWITARIVEGDVIATALSGQRVQISTSGIATYNASDAVTATLSAASGGLSLAGLLQVAGDIVLTGSGTFKTATSGRRVEMTTNMIRVYPDDPNLTYLHLTDGYLRWYSPFDESVKGYHRVIGADMTVAAEGHVTLTSANNGLTGDLRLFTAGGYEAGKFQTNQVYAFQAGTGSSRAVYVNGTTGNLHTASSSERFKDEIETLDLDVDHYFSGRAVSYVDKEQKRAHEAGEVWTTPDGEDIPIPPPTREFGRIAEEVHALGYSELVGYDNGEPADLKYEREVAPLYVAGQQHHRRIADLEQTVADLTARLEALEARA